MLAELAGQVAETGMTHGESQIFWATIALVVVTVLTIPVVTWSVLTEVRKMKHDDDIMHLLLEQEENRHDEKMTSDKDGGPIAE